MTSLFDTVMAGDRVCVPSAESTPARYVSGEVAARGPPTTKEPIVSESWDDADLAVELDLEDDDDDLDEDGWDDGLDDDDVRLRRDRSHSSRP